MDSKTRGWIYVVGGLISGWMSWQTKDWATLILSVLFLVSGYHHAFGK